MINSYKSGWQGVGEFPDPPVEGINEEIQRIREAGYEIVVVSTRCYQENGVEDIQDYLDRYGIEVDSVTHEKPPAVVTIDDRAICFDGESSGLLEKIQDFKPWYK